MPLKSFLYFKNKWRYFASIIRLNNEWLNPIISVCKPGFYDSTNSCLSGCGHCKDNATCYKESGRCTTGCEQHFEAPYCQGTSTECVDINSIYLFKIQDG